MDKEIAVLADKVITIAQENGRGAGEFVEGIASAEGDSKMLSVLSELDIMTIAKIIREYDATIPSIATWLLDADTIKKLVDVEPAYWQHEFEKGAWTAQDGAKTLLTQIFLSQSDDERQIEILKALSQDNNGLLYLSMPFIGFDFESIDFNEEQVSGSNAELAVKIRTLNESVYKEVVECSRSGNLDAFEAELIEQANRSRVGDLDEETDDMFEPI